MKLERLATIAKPIVKGLVRSHTLLGDGYRDDWNMRTLIEGNFGRVLIVARSISTMEDGYCNVILNPTESVIANRISFGDHCLPKDMLRRNCDLAIGVWFEFYTKGRGGADCIVEKFAIIDRYRPNVVK